MGKRMNISVKMTGKDYLDYIEKRSLFPKKWTNKHTGGLIIILSLCGLLLIPFIHEYFAPPPPPQINWGYVNLWGVSVHNGLIVWFALAIGIAWIFHGFGFIIVRR